VNPESVKSFVTYYLQGLKERTRREQSGTKWGIDWVVYNLGLAKFGRPIRLPFIRAGTDGYPKTKTEAEFGVDLAFLSEDARHLAIFVLKDEPLTNRSWTKNDFDRDLRMAITPDLDAQDLDRVESINVILVYNKDDEENGVELFNRFVADAPTRIRDHVPLSFDRWNLARLVELTIQNILSASLLPERFFGQLSYISAQAADFRHGSEAWGTQLVPNWRKFIDDVLSESSGPRGPALVPVALIIVRERASSNQSFETGWIELLEWSAIALWRHRATTSEPDVVESIRRFWREFYIAELERFYRTYIHDLATEYSIDCLPLGTYVGTVGSAYVIHWHIARLGILFSRVRRGPRRSKAGSRQA